MKGKEMILLQNMHNHRGTTKPKKIQKKLNNKNNWKNTKKNKAKQQKQIPPSKKYKKNKQNRQKKAKNPPKVWENTTSGLGYRNRIAFIIKEHISEWHTFKWIVTSHILYVNMRKII